MSKPFALNQQRRMGLFEFLFVMFAIKKALSFCVS